MNRGPVVIYRLGGGGGGGGGGGEGEDFGGSLDFYYNRRRIM